MSQENVEIVRRAFDAWNRRDLDTLIAAADPGIEYVNAPTAVEPGTRRGVAEVSAVWRAQWETLDGRVEVDRFFDHGDEIIALGRLRVGYREAMLGSRIASSVRGRSAMGRSSGSKRSALAGPKSAALEAAGLRE